MPKSTAWNHVFKIFAKVHRFVLRFLGCAAQNLSRFGNPIQGVLCDILRDLLLIDNGEVSPTCASLFFKFHLNIFLEGGPPTETNFRGGLSVRTETTSVCMSQ